MDEQLKRIREKIDEIDSELLDLFAKRIAYAKEIAEIKKSEKTEILQLEREMEIFKKIKEFCNEKNIDSIFAEKIFNILMLEMKDIQEKEMKKSE